MERVARRLGGISLHHGGDSEKRPLDRVGDELDIRRRPAPVARVEAEPGEVVTLGADGRVDPTITERIILDDEPGDAPATEDAERDAVGVDDEPGRLIDPRLASPFDSRQP